MKWEQGFSCVAAACLVPGPCTDTFAHETFEDGVRSLTSCRAEKSTPLQNDCRATDSHFSMGPRQTGDGYYESMVADPEGNRFVIAE